VLLATFVIPESRASDSTSDDLSKNFSNMSLLSKSDSNNKEQPFKLTDEIQDLANPFKETELKGAGAAAKDWNFSFAPYLWLVGLNGTIGVRGQEVDVDISFGDIWDNLDFAFQGHAEIVYRSQFGFIVDGTYLKLSTKDVKGPFNTKTTTRIDMWEFIGFYRVYNQPTGYSEDVGYKKSSVFIDLLAGGRYMNIDNTINFGGNGPIGISNQISGSQGWFDFLLGARIKWQATDRFFLVGRTDFGGFGLSFSSDFAWNIQGFFGFDITNWMQALIGYRVFYDDYSDGKGDERFVYDAWMQGPVIGLNFVF